MRDTHPEAEGILRDIVMRQSLTQRFAVAIQLSEDVRAIALAELRRQHPDEPLLTLIERLTGEPMRPMARSGPLSAP